MKHELNRLGPDGFEQLIQALMARLFGVRVKIYGDGPDRQREAVIEDAHHTVCGGVEALGRTIVQAKYKSPDGKQEDWAWLQTNLSKELNGFAEKAKSEPEFIPDTWLFFTNLILTPGEGGVKDRADAFAAGYSHLIKRIYILGADEIRALLDANPDVARRYAAFLTPGDALAESLDYLDKLRLKPLAGLMEYVRQRFKADEPVRLEQAGSASESEIKVKNVYTDLEAEGELAGEKLENGLAAAILRLGDRPHPRGFQREELPRPNAPEDNLVLIGDAGQGKSTLCQYICQLYRASLLSRYSPEVAAALDYAEQTGMKKPNCERFPVLFRLKDYAGWIKKRQDAEENCSVLHYLLFLIQKESETALDVPALRELLSGYSWFFFFDGLDEVPVSSNRSALLRQIGTFLEGDLAEAGCDCLVVCTSRPQGYDSSAFSRRFRHVALKDMSPALCVRYMDRLLTLLERDSSYREKYRDILLRALDDPLVAKLMTTPLYTAILVLLVKSGSTPPTRRYELFREYCNTVIRRELQKELLPSLYEGDYAWVWELHGFLAYLLQSESETAGNAAAELFDRRFRALIHDYLTEEQWGGDHDEMSVALYHAMTERLPFLAATTDAEGESCVLFKLRSMQEYFAAERLLRVENEEQRRDMLSALSRSAYWRNVFLFAAGYYSAANRQTVNDTIYAICLENNGGDGEGKEDTACHLALSGSRLALDLLCDNLFERRGGQTRYLNLAAELLEWDYTGGSPLPAFQKLPPALLARLIREKAIPRLQIAKDTNEAAFALLCLAAQNRNAEARNALEDLADSLLPPTQGTFNALLEQGTDQLGAKLLRSLVEWIPELYSMGFFSLGLFSRVISDCCTAESWERLPETVLRLFGYLFLGSGFNEVEASIIFSVSSPELEYLVEQDTFLSLVGDARQKGFEFIRSNATTTSFLIFVASRRVAVWRKLANCATQEGFGEIAALASFHAEPTVENLEALLIAYLELAKSWRSCFRAVLRNQDLPLREFAEALDRGVEPIDLLSRFDDKWLQSSLERTERIRTIFPWADATALNTLDAFPYLKGRRYGSMWWPSALLNTASNRSFQALISSFGLSIVVISKDRTIRNVLFHRFPLCFLSSEGTEVALIAFAHESPAFLTRMSLKWPSALPRVLPLLLEREYTIPSVLERIKALSAIGEDCLGVYSLLPYVFPYADMKTLRGMAEDAAQRYEAVRVLGNDCALLGVILLLLTGETDPDRQDELAADLRRLMAGIDPSLWYRCTRQFSLAGELLAHEAGMEAYRDTAQEKRFLRRSRCALLRSLDALPAQRDKLPAVGVPACV